ncbi:MAG TPA: N-formylglutamate deformylase [Polyangiales bacterium]|nr:N-formylglutamate deformylase [Polyangiales bacterium]
MSDWLAIQRGAAPLIVSFPHTGTEIPSDLERRMVSPWLARKDADHWVHLLYDFAAALGATTIRTRLSRSVIDVNRDPSGASLYPGQNTTELCPLTTFDGEALYKVGEQPAPSEVAHRRATFYEPYQRALAAELERLRAQHPRVVLYDAHSIRSHVPRLFEGRLPVFNLGTNGGASCDPALSAAVEQCCVHPEFDRVVNGRFKGGYITRHYARPEAGVHTLQMELACRSYLDEPELLKPGHWPPAYDPARAAALKTVLEAVLRACLDWSQS